MLNDKIKFYDVTKDYLEFLKQSEIEKRGFTRIPEYGYGKNEKFVCGVVLKIDEFEYYAPISSFKIQQQSNIIITDSKNHPLSSIRFSFMFPVPQNAVSVKDFNKEEQHYKRLLLKEYQFCLKNIDKIYKKARDTYNKIVGNLSPSMNYSCCDFKLLEQSMLNYIALEEIEQGQEQAASAIDNI